MVVGSLRLDLLIRQARSLKGKRQVISSLKDRIRHRFNVAVSEVDHLELRQRACLGVASVSSEHQIVDNVLKKVVEFVRFQGRGAEVIDATVEFF